MTVRALDSVEFALYRGEIVVLLGASGSGKSTLLNIVGGLDPPNEGNVFFKQEKLTEFDDPALTAYRRDHVGFVFQLYDLIPSLTAKENVSLVTETALNPVAPEEALTLVGLGDRIDHFPSQLSGGDQQRVAIARTIAKRPEILLCDEPTGAPNLIANPRSGRTPIRLRRQIFLVIELDEPFRVGRFRLLAFIDHGRRIDTVPPGPEPFTERDITIRFGMRLRRRRLAYRGLLAGIAGRPQHLRRLRQFRSHQMIRHKRSFPKAL